MDNSKLRVSNGSGEAVRALVTNLRTPGSTVINLNTTVNWPTANGFVATTGPLLSDGTLDPAKMLVFLGHISGSTVIIDSLAPGYTDTYGNSVGDVVVIKPTTWWADTVAGAAESMQTFITQQGDWRAIGTTVSSVVYNGNRSYTAVLGADKSSILSPKMRLRSTRGTAAPTQSTSLNGTSQYWSKISPVGMAQTDDITAMVWVKVTSYQSGAIISKRTGQNGWDLLMNTDGTVRIHGVVDGSNYKLYKTYQSLPLNKWVHIAATMDMSANSAAIYFDGVSVPISTTALGTANAMTNATTLNIGTDYAGSYFPGKIAQVGIFSTVLSQATIRNYLSQGLVGSETSLVSAYSFNGSANDLNATNANNLTASGAATATNADSPFGGQAGGTISSTKDYGIIQSVSGTSVTFQVPEGCTVPTTGTVTFEYSTMDAPYGFPGQKEKFALEVKYKVLLQQTVSSTSAWLNIPGVSISSLPMGEWDSMLLFDGLVQTSVAGGYLGMKYTLSTATTTQSHDHLSGHTSITSANSVQQNSEVTISGPISNSAQITFYLNAQPNVLSGTTTAILGVTIPAEFKFYNAYL